MTIRILIVDDHSVVRQGLRMFLRWDPQLEVVGEAQDGAEALRLARQLQPDVVLMDLVMPLMDGIAATAAIRQELPETEVLALTSVLEDASVVGAVRAGAIGYLLKDTNAPELCRAIKVAAAGQVQLTPKAAARLMQAVNAPKNPETLTERETEVLRLVAQGQANKQIAASLHIHVVPRSRSRANPMSWESYVISPSKCRRSSCWSSAWMSARESYPLC